MNRAPGDPWKPGTRLPLDESVRDGPGALRPLRDALGAEGIFLAFVKDGCPTCELYLPFLDRIARHHGPGPLPVVIVCQGTPEEARALAARLGLQHPVLADPAPHPASAAFALVTVPTSLRADEAGLLLRAQEGFSRAFLDDLDGELASIGGGAPAGVFEGEKVPELRAG